MITKSSGNVFRDLGFEQSEATNLRIRAELMRSIRDTLESKRLKQREIAQLLQITQPRVSDLLNGKIDRFSIDSLVNMLSRLNVQIRLDVDPESGRNRSSSGERASYRF